MNYDYGRPDDPQGSNASATRELESALRIALLEERRILDEVTALPSDPLSAAEAEFLQAAQQWIAGEETRKSTTPAAGRGKSALAPHDSPWRHPPSRRWPQLANLSGTKIAAAATIAFCVGLGATALLQRTDRDDPRPGAPEPRYLGGEAPTATSADGVTTMPDVVDWSEIGATRPGPYRVRIKTAPPHHDDPGEIVYEMAYQQFPSLWACPRNLMSALPDTFLFQVLANDLSGDEEVVYQRLFSPPVSQD